MASWRDADDPRCPECDEPIAATASYCMHCDADLPMDDSADVSDADDVTRSGATTGATERSGGLAAWIADRLSFNRTEYPGSSPGGAGTGSPSDASADDDGSPGQASASSKASLALRLPTAIFVSIPVPFLSLFVALSVVSPMSGGLALLVFAGSWFAAIAWLARRPLPSEVVGDAFYLVAGILVAGPVVNQSDLLLRRLFAPETVGVGVVDIVLGLFAWELVVLLPVAVLLLFGWAGNAWAARKLDPDEESGESKHASGDPNPESDDPGAATVGDR